MEAEDAPPPPVWRALLTWALGWAALLALDGRVDLANLALVLVLTSVLASLWLPAWASVAAGGAGVLAFNWTFVPPRQSMAVDLRQHALLLGAMLAVSAIVSVLVARQRQLARRAQADARREARLHAWAETLRDAADPLLHAGTLRDTLAAATALPAVVWVDTGSDEGAFAGAADAAQRTGLRLCTREGAALGPGSGRHDQEPDLYLPLRGRGACFGAAVLPGAARRPPGAALRQHLQALCDQMGLALQRARIVRDAAAARGAAEAEAVRNTMLAAIAHDFRTPLATLMGAASSLVEQGERMDAAQRRRLAQGIVDESARLARLADNTLQLARLGAPAAALACDWESGEEIVGALLARVRPRDPARRVRARLEPGLPLLWCDALLVGQLLENLVDNALKYSPPEAPVELLLRRDGDAVLLAVRDRGPGVAPGARERIFQAFERGAAPMAGRSAEIAAGAGVGLAVCRAIAQAHGGTLALRARAHGGSAFECRLPLRSPPDPSRAPTPGPAVPSGGP